MRDINEFARIMQYIYRYCSCRSGGCISDIKSLFPELTKILNLEKNKAWYKFCVDKDRSHVNEYTNIALLEQIKYDGNRLAQLPADQLTWSKLNIALHALHPITISTIRSNKDIRTIFTNKYIAKIIKEYTIQDKAERLDSRLFSLWHKNDESFEKLFNAHTLSEQLKLIDPIGLMLREITEPMSKVINKLKRLNIKGNFNEVVRRLAEYIERYKRVNRLSNPFGNKVRVSLSEDVEENMLFMAYLKSTGRELPKWETCSSMTYTTHLKDCVKLLEECLIMKYEKGVK